MKCWPFNVPGVSACQVCEDCIRSMLTARSDLAARLLARLAGDRHALKTIGVVTTAATPGILRQVWQEGMQEAENEMTRSSRAAAHSLRLLSFGQVTPASSP